MEAVGADVFQRALRKSVKATQEVEWLTTHVEFIHTLLTPEQKRILAAHYATPAREEEPCQTILTGEEVERIFEEEEQLERLVGGVE
jgi:hypothetical protein